MAMVDEVPKEEASARTPSLKVGSGAGGASPEPEASTSFGSSEDDAAADGSDENEANEAVPTSPSATREVVLDGEPKQLLQRQDETLGSEVFRGDALAVVVAHSCRAMELLDHSEEREAARAVNHSQLPADQDSVRVKADKVDASCSAAPVPDTGCSSGESDEHFHHPAVEANEEMQEGRDSGSIPELQSMAVDTDDFASRNPSKLADLMKVETKREPSAHHFGIAAAQLKTEGLNPSTGAAVIIKAPSCEAAQRLHGSAEAETEALTAHSKLDPSGKMVAGIQVSTVKVKPFDKGGVAKLEPALKRPLTDESFIAKLKPEGVKHDVQSAAANGISHQFLSTFIEIENGELDEFPDNPNDALMVIDPAWLSSWHLRAMGPVLEEIKGASKAFWIRRVARRRALKVLAEECAKFAQVVREAAVEVRHEAARRRLELLRAGDVEGYQAALGQLKESRLQEIMDETASIVKKLTSSHSSGAETQPIQQPKSLKGGGLMPHQIQGLRWLASLFENKMSGILADDMGLGKTCQAIALLAFMWESRDIRGPHLVIAPMSVLHHWAYEIRRWAPHMSFMVFRPQSVSAMELSHAMYQEWHNLNIVLISFEMFTLHHTYLYPTDKPWHTVVIDEGHRLKNSKTLFSRVVRALPCCQKLLLTGTPLQNDLRELWSLLAFVAPREFGSLADFEQWFSLPAAPKIGLGNAGDGTPEGTKAMVEVTAKQTRDMLSEEEEMLIIQRLHNVLRPFMLRRTKALVLKDLPEKVEVVVKVPMTYWQQALYRQGLRKVKQENGEMKWNKACTFSLRKAVNHPYLYVDGDAQIKAKQENLFRTSGKFEFLDRVVPRLIRHGHKLLIFSQMTTSLNLLAELLNMHSLKYFRIDGSKSALQRAYVMDQFRCSEDHRIMLLSTRAGGCGLNLQAADTVILFDSDWNPQVDLQAMDRVYRIGQTRPVRVIRLMTPTGIDEGLLARAYHKLDLERKVIGAGRFCGGSAVEDDKDNHYEDVLKQLLRDAKGTGGGKGGLRPTPLTEVNRLIARSEEERIAFDREDTELLGEACVDDAGQEQCVARRLESCGRLMARHEVPHDISLSMTVVKQKSAGVRGLQFRGSGTTLFNSHQLAARLGLLRKKKNQASPKRKASPKTPPRKRRQPPNTTPRKPPRLSTPLSRGRKAHPKATPRQTPTAPTSASAKRNRIA